MKLSKIFNISIKIVMIKRMPLFLSSKLESLIASVQKADHEFLLLISLSVQDGPTFLLLHLTMITHLKIGFSLRISNMSTLLQSLCLQCKIWLIE